MDFVARGHTHLAIMMRMSGVGNWSVGTGYGVESRWPDYFGQLRI